MNWPTISLDAVSAWQVGVVFFACLIAAIWDVAVNRIPNILTLPMIIGGLAWAAWRHSAMGFFDAIAASFILALPYLLLFMYAKGGAGDVKLMAGIGAWTGLACGLVVLLLIALSGVVIGIAVELARRQCQAVVTRLAAVVHLALAAIVRRSPAALSSAFLPLESKNSQPMPYGVAIFAGVCLASGGFLLWHA